MCGCYEHPPSPPIHLTTHAGQGIEVAAPPSPAEEHPLTHTPLPLPQIAQLLDVPEEALHALIADREADSLTQGDATLVGLTVAEAARRIGIGRTKLYEYVTSGQIPSVKIGRLRRIPAEAVAEFLTSRLNPADFDTAA
jgi:excisionase family DNA binding protein